MTKKAKGGETEAMCLVDSSTSIDIDSAEIGDLYKCNNCNTEFRGIGKKIRCPTCESKDVKKM